MSETVEERTIRFKKEIATRANRIWKVLEAADIEPFEIGNYTAMGLIFAVGCKAAQIDRDAFLGYCAEAFDESAVYEADLEGEEEK